MKKYSSLSERGEIAKCGMNGESAGRFRRGGQGRLFRSRGGYRRCRNGCSPSGAGPGACDCRRNAGATLARRFKVNMPITFAVDEVLNRNAALDGVIVRLVAELRSAQSPAAI
jgi:hypothetical protein